MVLGTACVAMLLAAGCSSNKTTSLSWIYYGATQDGRTLHLIAAGSACSVGKPWATVKETSVSVQINIKETVTTGGICVAKAVPLKILLRLHHSLGDRGLAGCVTAYPDTVMRRCLNPGKGWQAWWNRLSRGQTFSLP